eukprot:18274-Pyramimonas_sp.AAC.1
MQKPVRKVRRTIRRAFRAKGKGRGNNKGKRRRPHDRGRGRMRTSGKGKGRRGNPKDANGKPWNVISAIAHNISVASALKAMGEAGVHRCIWLKPIRKSSMSIGGRC